MLKQLMAVICFMGLTACTGLPENVQPAQPFELSRYTGTWYEIARLDHSFERGLSNVTATYSLDQDGDVIVLNHGFNPSKNEWQKAQGKAKFVDQKTIGHLKVSFFGPFYGSYVIFGLDQENYAWSFVTSYNTEYAWLLARTPQVDETVKAKFITKAKAIGVDTEALIWVEQEKVKKTP